MVWRFGAVVGAWVERYRAAVASSWNLKLTVAKAARPGGLALSP